MAAATNAAMSTCIPSSFLSLKKKDSLPGSLQQGVAVELNGAVKSRASRGPRVWVADVRNMAPELVEMEPASQGSQLLGNYLCLFYHMRTGFLVLHIVLRSFF